MSKSPVFRPHDEAPAIATFRAIVPGPAWAGLDARKFDYVSRGDFVEGRVYLPATTPDRLAPLVLLTHGTGESAASESLDFAASWVRNGFAVAAIDLPLHGRRTSPKLSERLFRTLGELARGEEIGADSRALAEEFARQATSDLIRGIDALCALPEVDSARIGLVGLGIGATVSAYLLAHDDRASAFVVAGGAGRLEDTELDPAARLAERGPRLSCQTLVIAIAGAPDVAPGAARALFEAVSEPKEFAEISAGPVALAGIPQEASKHTAAFLEKHLAP